MTLIAWQLLGMLVLIVLSAIFSSAEVAYTGLSSGQLKRVGRIWPDALRLWEENPDRVLATLLLSNNAVNTGVGVLAASIALTLSSQMGWRHSLVTTCAGILASIVLLLFGEIIPKVWARRLTVPWALGVTPFIRFWSFFVAPISQAGVMVTHKILLRQKLKKKKKTFFQQSELRRIITYSIVPLGSRKILHNVIDFSRSQVAEVMTPRAEIFSVSLQQPMEKIILSVIQSGFSRVLVFDGAKDNYVGILYSKDLLVAWRSGILIVLEDLLRPIRYVNKDMPLPELLRIFREGRQHLALVIDSEENKRTRGLVTIQDALEAIFGEIREEA